MDFPSGPVDKNLPANAGDMGLIPGPGRFYMAVVEVSRNLFEGHMPRALFAFLPGL